MHEHRPIGTAFFPLARVGVAIGFVMGVAGLWFRPAPPVPAPPVAVPAAATAPAHDDPPRTLRGPSASVTLPLRGPVVVHVWLQGCRDCMPAFAAFKRLKEMGALDDMAQLNVAYGSATPQFAAEWRVDDRLVFDDDGAAVVRPFNIGSFTTLVINAEGEEILRARPDEPGYIEQVRKAYRLAQGAEVRATDQAATKAGAAARATNRATDRATDQAAAQQR